MSTLDTLEKSFKKEIWGRSVSLARPHYSRAFWAALVFSPFLLTVAIIVPFVGQVLVLIAAFLTLTYLWCKRSILLLGSALLGSAAGFGILISISTILKKDGAPFFYALAALCMFFSITYIVLIAGRIWMHLEQGRKELSGEQ